MEQKDKYEQAKRRVAEIRKFYGHLTIYILVMIGLFVVDYQDRGNWWFYWPLIGWGIAVVLHAFRALGAGWEERKIKELMGEEEHKEE